MSRMKKFDVIEDNGGGLAILVYTNDRALVEYIHTGYEFNPSQLIEDLTSILEGADPLTEWDCNEVVDDEQRCFDYWYDSDYENIGWWVIANEETSRDEIIELQNRLYE